MVLACRWIIGSHTYNVLAEKMEYVLKEYRIQNKTTGAVTDSGSNFVKAFHLFGTPDAEVPPKKAEDDKDKTSVC